MKKSTSLFPELTVVAGDPRIVSHAGLTLATRTASVLRLDREISAALAPWASPWATHDPGKIVLDLAVALAAGGDCLADIAVLRAQPQVFGPVASDPTVSRAIRTLADSAPKVLSALASARARVRARAWTAAGDASPATDIDERHPLIVDLDATLVTAHSDKQHARPTYKHGYGFHPLAAYIDHGPGGTGEPAAALLRPGNAGANKAADHITVTRAAVKQLPFVTGHRVGRKVLIRTDSAGSSHDFVKYLTGRRLSYSLGFTMTQALTDIVNGLPERAWYPAIDADRQPRDGAWVAELTGLADLDGWPAGMRLIVRKERPHPGAQLRFTDSDGLRLTAFVTNTRMGQLSDLELRHRRRARCEDRIRNAKDTGLHNLPLHGFTQNQIWLAITQLAGDLLAWMQMLALHGHPARRWEPKRLRHRMFSIAGRITRHARTTRLNVNGPHADLLITALQRLGTLAIT